MRKTLSVLNTRNVCCLCVVSPCKPRFSSLYNETKKCSSFLHAKVTNMSLNFKIQKSALCKYVVGLVQSWNRNLISF